MAASPLLVRNQAPSLVDLHKFLFLHVLYYVFIFLLMLLLILVYVILFNFIILSFYHFINSFSFIPQFFLNFSIISSYLSHPSSTISLPWLMMFSMIRFCERPGMLVLIALKADLIVSSTRSWFSSSTRPENCQAMILRILPMSSRSGCSLGFA